MKSFLLFINFFGGLLGTITPSVGNFYDFNVKDIHGDLVSLSKYKGKVSLVTNVASQCGYTEQNYDALVKMQNARNYKDDFIVLAFPSNSFEQELDTDDEIFKFVSKNYRINFPLFSKINVIGDNVEPAFKYLTETTGVEPKWNFWRYLVDQNGKVVKSWSHTVSFRKIYQSILDEINKPANQEIKDDRSEL